MTLSLKADFSRPGGGYARLEGPGLADVTAISIENCATGEYLGEDGKWGREPFAFPVEAAPSGALLLGPRIVDHVPKGLQVALRSEGGVELGKVFWLGLVTSRDPGSITNAKGFGDRSRQIDAEALERPRVEATEEPQRDADEAERALARIAAELARLSAEDRGQATLPSASDAPSGLPDGFDGFATSGGLAIQDMLELCAAGPPAPDTIEPDVLVALRPAPPQPSAPSPSSSGSFKPHVPMALPALEDAPPVASSPVEADPPPDYPAPPMPRSSGSAHSDHEFAAASSHAPRSSRATSLVWLAAGATILGGIGFAFRHEIAALVTGLFTKVSVIDPRGLLGATPPPPASPRPEAEAVDVSAFAPNGGEPGETVLVQVFLHMPRQARAVMARAREADPQGARRGCASLSAEVVRGQRLDLFLEGGDAIIDEPFQTVVWRGQPCACQFFARLPNRMPGGVCFLRVQVLLDRVPIGSLRFTLRLIAPATPRDPPARRGDAATRYRRAFLSYASADRAEVLKRAQSLRAAGITFFQDVLTLEPGERWAQRLYDEIDQCDLFLLFWSRHAATSDWVRREIDRARARQRRSPEETPNITPIILEGPPVPMPIPDQLAHLHFNDYLLYAIAGSAPEAGRT